MSNLFTSQTPGIPNVFEAQPVTLGQTLVFSSAGNVTGGRFYAPVTVTGTFELVLWEITTDDNPAGTGTGTLLASATFGTVTPSAWNSVVFASPVAVVTTKAYRLGLRTSDGRYAATGGFFASAGLTNGPITGPQTGTDPVGIGPLDDGSFIGGSITAYPNQTFNGNCYFIDPDFTSASAGTTVNDPAAPGAMLGGSPATAAASVVAADPAAPGLLLGGSPALAAASVTVNDPAAPGLLLGGSPAGAAASVTVSDPAAPGAMLGGSPAQAAADTLAGDPAAPGFMLGGSPAVGSAVTLAVDPAAPGLLLGGSPATVVFDGAPLDPAAPGLLLGGSPAGAAADVVASDVRVGLRLGGSPAAAASASDGTATALPNLGLRFGGSPATAGTSVVVHDQMVMPLAIKARDCLVAEVGKLANPPLKVQIRPGASFAALADEVEDECCGGIAYVRTGNRVPTTAAWPTPLTDVSGPSASRGRAALYAVNLELGIYRCLPTQSDVPESNGDYPTDAQWLQAAQDQADDGAALLRVVCCLQDVYGNDAVIAGALTPLENQANCSGIIVNVQLRAPACDCVD